MIDGDKKRPDDPAYENAYYINAKNKQQPVLFDVDDTKCMCADGRTRGCFQFYGANRTGRFSGRLIQLQNLPQNHLGMMRLAEYIGWPPSKPLGS